MLMLVSIQLASAVELKLSKQTYAPGETLQAEIYGNFLDPLKLENIFLYRERSLPVVYDILKLKDKYLLYVLLPYTEGNYSLEIKNARYSIPGGSDTEPITTEFNIQSTNETYLTINPGFIVAKGDFSVNIKSYTNQEISAEFDATGETKSVSLIQNLEKNLFFSILGITNYTESNLKIQSYNIPVFIFPDKSETQIMQETKSFRFNPPSGINATILKSQDFIFQVSLLNLGNKNLTDIKLSQDSSNEDNENLKVVISPETISELPAGEEKTIDLTFSSEEKESFKGNISAVSEKDGLTALLPFSLEITEEETEVVSETPSYTEESSCSEIGSICTAEQTCDGSLVFTSEGYCCKGACKKTGSNGSSYTWLWGILIIIAVLGGIGFLWYRMKKKQKKPEDILEKRKKSFEERMQNIRGEEVAGSLGKT